jgi:hypothetical protein
VSDLLLCLSVSRGRHPSFLDVMRDLCGTWSARGPAAASSRHFMVLPEAGLMAFMPDVLPARE